MARIVFHVQDADGLVLAGATIDATSPWGPWHGVTDFFGDFPADLGAAHYGLTIAHPGFDTVQMPADLEYPGTVPIVLHSSAGDAAIRTSGDLFLGPDGQPMRLIGIDQFQAQRQELDGVDLQPSIDEMRSLGFNMARVFLAGSKRQNQTFDLDPRTPGFIPALQTLVDRYNAADIVPLLTVGCDLEDLIPDEGAQLANGQQIAAAVAGKRALLSWWNEYGKNGCKNPLAFGKLAGVLCSRGSGETDAAPVGPHLDFAEFHQRRDLPAAQLDTVASAVTLYRNGVDVPLIMSEGFAVDENTDPFFVWQLARVYGTYWAAAVLHNRRTQFGQLLGPLTPHAEQWVRGMRS